MCVGHFCTLRDSPSSEALLAYLRHDPYMNRPRKKTWSRPLYPPFAIAEGRRKLLNAWHTQKAQGAETKDDVADLQFSTSGRRKLNFLYNYAERIREQERGIPVPFPG